MLRAKMERSCFAGKGFELRELSAIWFGWLGEDEGERSELSAESLPSCPFSNDSSWIPCTRIAQSEVSGDIWWLITSLSSGFWRASRQLSFDSQWDAFNWILLGLDELYCFAGGFRAL
ncbi:hypothetical protein COLO4_07132 [Corchorus olitorius]|uniref:Uncharacterized protein n=1 Tax=Corchorus olitorius TaxID=93759 RepID=A0A1R3KKS3_9ROSI|nr:hypothetical protein COLO4_07132 [Corchorus olitorius]